MIFLRTAAFFVSKSPTDSILQANPLTELVHRPWPLPQRDTTYRGDIHHLPWPLQDATVQIEENTIAQAAGIDLPPAPRIVRFARELKVLIWALERVA